MRRRTMTTERESAHFETSSGVRVFIGTTGLFFAAAVLFLALIDGRSNLSFMPASWFVHRPLWYLFALVGFMLGFLLLRNPAVTDADSAVRFNTVVLYTRQKCPLCDRVKEMLRNYGPLLPEVTEVDVDKDPKLCEKFGSCVPVVEFDGKIRFRGQINEILLRRLIEGTPPRD